MRGCWYFYDSFNEDARQGSTDMGSDWHEETGDWGIASFVVQENFATGGGTSGAKLITTQAEPVASAGEQMLSLKVFGAVTNDLFYLYPCCTSMHSPGPAVVEFKSLSNMFQWRVTVGTDVKTITVVPEGDGSVTLVACVDTNISMCKAWVNPGINQEPAWDDSLDPGAGRYSGCGHDNAAASGNLGAVFDDYFVSELETSLGVLCYSCFCMCQDWAPHKDLTLYLANATGRADCVVGTTALTWEWVDGGRWKAAIAVTGSNAITHTLTFYLYCENEHEGEAAGQNFVLKRPIAEACCSQNPELCLAARPTAASYCSPSFFLEFGPYRLLNTDLLCTLCYNPDPWSGTTPATGSYYVWITDP